MDNTWEKPVKWTGVVVAAGSLLTLEVLPTEHEPTMKMPHTHQEQPDTRPVRQTLTLASSTSANSFTSSTGAFMMPGSTDWPSTLDLD